MMRELPRGEATILHELKALLGATVARAGTSPIWDDSRNTSMVRQTYHYDDFKREQTYVFMWGNNPKRAALKGRLCVVEAYGAKNTVLVRFLDTGEKVTTSRHAVRVHHAPGPMPVTPDEPIDEPLPEQMRLG